MPFDYENVVDVDLEQEMKKAYIDYAMSVIVSRALPDARDGLKPVHRRIIYTMYEDNLTPDKEFRKCAMAVGDVLGRYHPHGDASVYDALVRLAQDFSLRYPFVDGHGNFGSVDGDPAAAYRYTEARLQKIAMEMVRDIDKDTVDFIPNYDEHCLEPSVLPSKIPALLVNGSSGIAVGMATNIPPHNLCEVVDACIALLDDENLTIEDLMEYIKGPDFPTAGLIMGRGGIRTAYMTGRGKVTMRARAEIEEHNNRSRIVITEIPYLVNKAMLVSKIAELVKDKRVEGISDIRDETSREGMRIVIEVKRDAIPSIILNHLYKFTQLQETCGVNMLALVDNKPKVLNLKEALECYIGHQRNIIKRRTKFDLEKALAKAHILEGLRVAIENIDEVIAIIRSSYDDAKERLIARFSFSDEQVKAILDMRLARLSGLEKEKIDNDLHDLRITIEELKEILADEKKVDEIIKTELTEVKDKYGDARRTEIVDVIDSIEDEDLVPEEDVVITFTHIGYVKRLTADTYRSQRRGGRGVSGLATREEDFVEELFVCSTHNYILFFTNLGKMYKLKAYQIPEASRQAKGSAIVNLLPLQPNEKITTMIPVSGTVDITKYLVMITKQGIIKKTAVSEYNSNRKGGLYAISINEDDELINVNVTDGSSEVFVVTHEGKSIRFKETDVRPMGRTAHGVKAIDLADGDYVIGSAVVNADADMLVVTENGLGKLTSVDEYKVQTRAGKGVKTYKITEKTGTLAGVKAITPDEDVMLITSQGTVIRTAVSGISKMGRATQGVMLMRLADGEKIVSISKAPREEEEEIPVEETQE